MKNIKVSDTNKSRLDVLLARKIGKEQNPAVIMDDVVTELLDLWEAQTK